MDQDSPVSRAASQRLYKVGLGSLIVTCVGLAWMSPLTDILLKLMGIASLVMSAWPALSWARQGRTWFPAFEIFMLTNINFYAVPLLTLRADENPFPSGVIWQSALIVCIYQLAANFTFSAVRGGMSKSRGLRVSLLPEAWIRYIPAGLILSTLYLYVSAFTDWIPYDLAGTLRAIFFGLGIIGTFILARLYGSKRLRRETLVFLILNLVAQLILLTSQLYLIGAISIMVLALIGYISSSRKIPWVPLCILLPLLAVLHSGKADMRKIYWAPDAPKVEFTQLPEFFTQWVAYGFSPSNEPEDTTLTTGLLKRASLFQMLCLSVEHVPEQQPYLGGESYIDVPALLVPRFLWPNKPSALQSNVRLALYFGLVDEESAYKVSIAFGMLAEAYINFGLLGAGLLGVFFGWALKHAATRSDRTPYFSALGLFMIVLTAWSFQAEQVFATWITSLFQCSVVVIGLPLAYRRFFGAT